MFEWMDDTHKSFKEVTLGKEGLTLVNDSVSGLGLGVRLQDLEGPTSCMMLLELSLVRLAS